MKATKHFLFLGPRRFCWAAIAVPLLTLELAGCATVASRYPRFTDAVDDTQELSVVVDVCMATDVRGKIEFIALDVNAHFAERISSHVHYELEKQGYRINTNIVTSVGGVLGEDSGAKAVVSLRDNSAGLQGVPLPYFVHADGLPKDDLKSVIGLVESLFLSSPRTFEQVPLARMTGVFLQVDPSGENEVYSQDYFKEGIGFVVLVTGRNRMDQINPDEIVFEAAGLLATGGPFAIPALPVILPFTVVDGTLYKNAMVRVWALGAETDSILWHETKAVSSSSGVADPDDIVEALDEVLRRLPDRSTR